MVPQGEGRSGPKSGDDDFEGLDLLVGRPEGAAPDRLTAEAADSPAAPTTSLLPAAHNDSIREVLATIRATAARIDALQDAPGSEHETVEALARATAALTQAVGDTRGALAKAGEVAERHDGAAEAAEVLAEGVAALKTQGEALDQRIRATRTQAEANARQAEAAAQGMTKMKQAATMLDSSLRIHAENMFRITQNQRWRPWSCAAMGSMLARLASITAIGRPERSHSA